MGRLLLVDDDPDLILAQINHVFGAAQHRIDVARTGEEGIRRVTERAPDVVLLDLRLPDLSGLDVYQRIRQIDARIPVIFVTTATAADTAIEAMKQGAYDYLFKPLDPHHLRRVVGQALELAQRMREPAVVAESAPDPTGRRHHRLLPRHARGLQGDRPGRGPGCAGADHRRERHRQGTGRARHPPARPAGQRAVPGHQLRRHPGKPAGERTFRPREGRLHRRRAAPDRQVRAVLRRHAFLDEIGDMPLASQAKLLRVLQEQAFERVGGNETIRTDVRLIAATHRDLEAGRRGQVPPGSVLSLDVFTIHLPPLRERGDDLPMLVRHYVRRFNRELGREVREVTPERWTLCATPGREHPRAAERAEAGTAACDRAGPVPEFLPAPRTPHDPRRPPGRGVCGSARFLRESSQDRGDDLYQRIHHHVDHLLLPLVLESTGGNQVQAAQRLGITRRTLRLRLRALGVSDLMSAEEDEDDAACGSTEAGSGVIPS